MTKFEYCDRRESKGSLTITSEGGKQYNLYFHRYGVSIANGATGNGGTIYESVHVDFALIPESIRIEVMWTFVEAAIAAVDERLITELDSCDNSIESMEFIRSYRIGIGRYSNMADFVRNYLEERSESF